MKRGAWKLSRRTLLKGLGTAVALPFLEAMIPPGRGLSLAEEAASPRRTLFYYVPNGIQMDGWHPTGSGEDFTLSQTLSPLAELRSQLLVLSGLDMFPATDQGDGGGDHGRGTGAFLTGVHVQKTEGDDIRAGVSIDQLIAQAQEGLTPYRSLELGLEGGSSAGDCDAGYSCAYTRNISWSGPSTPLAKETNPQLLFDRLFAGSDPRETEAQRARRILYEQSILDFVSEDAARLSAGLGASDKMKLDEYMTGIRDLETRLSTPPSGASCAAGERPEVAYDIQTKILQMSDLMVLALQCDRTRVVSFMQANAISNRTFPFLGISEGHHTLSHHRGNEEKKALLRQIDEWEVEMVAALARKMAAVTEPDGSNLLDHSTIFFGSELGDGQLHEHTALPILLLGGGGGALRGGRHLAFPAGTPLCNLFLNLAANMGVVLPGFGDDGTGPLEGLG